MASIPKLPRETSSRRLWVDGFSSSTFHPWQLTLFEIPNKSFVLYAFISKNRQILFCIFFRSCFAILQLRVFFFFFFFQYTIFIDCTILIKCFVQRSPSLEKKPAIHTPKTFMNWVRVKNSNSEIFENVSFKNHYKSKGENSW